MVVTFGCPLHLSFNQLSKSDNHRNNILLLRVILSKEQVSVVISPINTVISCGGLTFSECGTLSTNSCYSKTNKSFYFNVPSMTSEKDALNDLK